MKTQALGLTACTIAVVMVAVATSNLTPAVAGGRDSFPPLRMHYNGLLNDYTPSAAVVKGGPYEMRGKWSLDVNQRRGTATFSAAMNMETSDYGMPRTRSTRTIRPHAAPTLTISA
ncbi:MAG TPA: hypothetical protein VNO35_28385 [Steroidobacteraceae bacterium]|nr:hypothetical protein [Steroidobacteraceae bacterium]